MDGYVSSIYTIAVGSVDQFGHQAPYDEDCSSKLAVTFNHNVNSRNTDHIVSTNLHSPPMLLCTVSQMIFIFSFHDSYLCLNAICCHSFSIDND